MKRFLCLLMCLTLYIYASCQTKKAFIDAKGVFGADKKKAVNYILITKLSDSAYQMKKFDMRDTIVMQGVFSDSLLKVPNGKFTYYKKDKLDDRLRDVVHIDENNYIKQVGFYSNGQKTGTWVEFEKRNWKSYSYTYENDKLNGTYLIYNQHDNKLIDNEGNYINDKKNGDGKLTATIH